MSQKSSTINVIIKKNQYFLKAKITIPEDYPQTRVDIQSADCNFPRVFRAWFVENSRELARRCVEAPKNPKPNAPK